MIEEDIDALNLEAEALYQKLDFQKSSEIVNKAHKLATKLKYHRGIAESLMTMGSLFWVQQDNLKAREVFTRAYKIIATIDDKALLNNVYSKLGITYGQLYLSEECVHYLSEALDVSISMKKESQIARDYTNLAIALTKFENFHLAIDYYNKAMTYAKKLADEKMQAAILTNQSRLYRMKGDYELALQHSLEALQLAEKYNETRNIITIYHNIGASSVRLKRFEDAEKYAKLCLTLANENNVTPLVTRAELLLAEIYLLQGRFDKAKEMLHQVEKLPAFKGDVEAIYIYYDLFLKVYEATADFKHAYEKVKEFMEFDRKQAEENLKAKLEIQELRLTLKRSP